ncbi:hypothetical protein ES703_61070 [subsurface metagenome]
MSSITINRLRELISDEVDKLKTDQNFEDFKQTKSYEELMRLRPNKLLGSGEDKPSLGTVKKAKEMFGSGSDSDGGFDKLGDVLLGISQGDSSITNRLEKDSSTLVGESAGFLLPSAFSNVLLDMTIEENISMKKSKIYNLGRGKGKTITIPCVKDEDHSSNVAGISVYWTGELANYQESDFTIRQLKLEANKLTCLTECSLELLHDSAINAESLIGSIFSKAISFEIDNCVLNTGTGGGQILGIPQSGAVIEIEKEAEQDPDTVVLANVEQMISRILPSSFPKAYWLSSLTCLPSLMHLNYPVGTTAISYNPFFSMTEKDTWKLYNRPLIFSEHIPVVGDSGALQLIDFQRYCFLILQDISIKSDTSLGFKSDKVAFKCSMRIDAQPMDTTYMTPKKGDTLSAFVKLGEV